MTETELSEVLIQIERQRLELMPSPSNRRTGRNYQGVRSLDELMSGGQSEQVVPQMKME